MNGDERCKGISLLGLNDALLSARGSSGSLAIDFDQQVISGGGGVEVSVVRDFEVVYKTEDTERLF